MLPLGIRINPMNRHTLPDCAKAGLTICELALRMEESPTTEDLSGVLAFAKETVAMIKGEGLTLRSVHLPFSYVWNPTEPDAKLRKAAVDAQNRLVAESAEWGAEVAVVHASVGKYPAEEREMRETFCRDSLYAMSAFAAPYGVRIAAENLPVTSLCNCSDALLRVTDFGRASKICFDVNHLFLETHAEFIEKAGNFIIDVHLSDYDGVTEKHWLPGMGVVPWKQVVDQLTSCSYPGALIFELRDDENDIPYAPARIVETFNRLIEA